MFDWMNVEKWAYRAAIAVLSLSLWWSNHTIDRLQTDAQAKERAVQAERLRAEGEFNEKLSKATNELVLQLRSANDLIASRSADLERMRVANTKLQTRLKNSNTAGADGEALSRCSELLAEGAELVTEGEGLLLRHGAEHDALIGVSVK